MTEIKGSTFEWKGRVLTSPLTEKAPISAKSMNSVDGLATVTEKIIGPNNLRPVALLEKMIQISRAVVRITIPEKGVATGFMISPDVIMTNNHVFESENDAQNAIISFNYQIDQSGTFLKTDDYKCNTSFFHTNFSLDYSLVKVKGAPGKTWGYIQLPSNDTVNVHDDVFIIQHPGGEHKQISISGNEVEYIDDKFIQYLTDTMPGSSGSPVFNDTMHLVALHHSGGDIPEPSTGLKHFRNEGVRISAIIKDMPNIE